jgi:hypothetical protein
MLGTWSVFKDPQSSFRRAGATVMTAVSDGPYIKSCVEVVHVDSGHLQARCIDNL